MNKGLKDICFFGMIFLLIDQIIKIILSSKMIVNQSFIVIKDFFSITLVHNNGAAFSLLSGNTFLLIFIGLAALIGLIIYIKQLEVIDDFDIFTYSLLFGGIVGNLIDRIIYGYVIDYLSFNFNGYFFPIFNFADICIVISIVIMIFRTLREDLWK